MNFMTERYGFIKEFTFYAKREEHRWLEIFLNEVIFKLRSRQAYEKIYWSCGHILL